MLRTNLEVHEVGMNRGVHGPGERSPKDGRSLRTSRCQRWPSVAKTIGAKAIRDHCSSARPHVLGKEEKFLPAALEDPGLVAHLPASASPLASPPWLCVVGWV